MSYKTELNKLINSIDENTWIISDTHFNHSNICNFEPNRLKKMLEDDFEDTDDGHNKWLIKNWNSVVKEDDLVLMLGDFAWKGIQDIIPELNGRIILILGNHDRKGSQVYKGFTHVVRGQYLMFNAKLYIASSNDELNSSIVCIINERTVLLSHYPATVDEHRKDSHRINKRVDDMISLCDEHSVEVNIHGHTHSKCMDDSNLYYKLVNVSLENLKDMKPVRIGSVL